MKNVCPECGGVEVVKNGLAKSGRQRYRCADKDCGLQFTPGGRGLAPGVRGAVELMLGAGVHPVKIFAALAANGQPISLRWIYKLRKREQNGG